MLPTEYLFHHIARSLNVQQHIRISTVPRHKTEEARFCISDSKNTDSKNTYTVCFSLPTSQGSSSISVITCDLRAKAQHTWLPIAKRPWPLLGKEAYTDHYTFEAVTSHIIHPWSSLTFPRITCIFCCTSNMNIFLLQKCCDTPIFYILMFSSHSPHGR